MKLVNKDGSINPHDTFTYQNKPLKVIRTDANEHENTPYYKYSVWLAKDYIKNLENGKVTEISRKKLYELNIEL